MNKEIGLQIIENMSEHAIKRGLGLIIVGSVGYRNALMYPERLKDCDDIDCIFVYDSIFQLNDLLYIPNDLLNCAKQLLKSEKADMFSNKVIIDGICISADYISTSYLRGLVNEYPTGKSVYRYKLTDSVEKPYNFYCNLEGKQACYQKPVEYYENYYIYKLPIHWFPEKQNYFPGVLLNKLLYEPTVIYITMEQKQLLTSIYNMVYEFLDSFSSVVPPEKRIYMTAYRKEVIPNEIKLQMMHKKEIT